MTSLPRWTLIAAFLLTSGLSASAQPTALVGPTALNPADSTVIADATILIRGDEIAAVGPSSDVTVPDDATVHEMPDKYVMPGLIDGHRHVARRPHRRDAVVLQHNRRVLDHRRVGGVEGRRADEGGGLGGGRKP